MSIAIVTRGIICQTSSSAVSLLSWGFLCPSRLEIEIGFRAVESPPTCTFIYSQQPPQILDPATTALFSVPGAQMTGQKSPLLANKRPSVSAFNSPGLYKPKLAQLTGSKVTTLVGNKSLLLSEPEEPTLTSSGTQAPDIFDKNC